MEAGYPNTWVHKDGGAGGLDREREKLCIWVFQKLEAKRLDTGIVRDVETVEA